MSRLNTRPHHSCVTFFFFHRVVTVQVYKDCLEKIEKEAEDFKLSLKTTMLLASADPSIFEGAVVPMKLPLTKRLPPMQRKQSMAELVQSTKAKKAAVAHAGHTEDHPASLVQRIVAAVSGVLGRPHAEDEHSKKHMHVGLNEIFLFPRPQLFFHAVEMMQLLMTFFISICATQILPLVIRTDVTATSGGWIFGFVLPVVVNLFMLQQILSKSVLLRAVYELDESVAGAVCEDAKEARQALKNLRTTVHGHLSKSGYAEEEWPSTFQVKHCCMLKSAASIRRSSSSFASN